MIEKTLTVKYITSQTCFIYLPVSYRLGTEKCVKLTYGKEKTAYFSLSIPNVNIESQMLGIDSKYAKALGIEEHEPVYVSEIADLPIVTCLSIVPLSKEDYEVLEMLAENVQNTLLEQIRVVNSNQKLIIWIGQNVWVTVTVESVQPICPGKITALTEVHIKPPEENAVLKSKDIQQNQEEASPSKNLNTFLSSFVNSIYSRLFEEPPKKSKVFYDDYDVILRLIPLSSLCQVNHNTKSFYPFNVFVLKDSLGANFININSNSSPLFGCITLVDPAVTSVKEIYVRVCCIEDFIDFKNITIFSTENVFVSDLVLNHFECCLGTRIILKQVHKQPLVNEIEIHSKKTYLEDMVEKLKFYLTSSTFPFILNSDIAMKVDDNFTFSVKLLPDFSNYCIIDENFLRNCKYSIHNECVNLKELNVKTLEHGDEYVQISNFKNIVEDAVNNFSSKQLENVLITGKPGTGKSTLVKTVSLKLSKFPYFIYSEAISCRQVKGKTIESLSKMLTITVSKLILCQPSILILEDLDVLCEKCQGEETPNSLYFNRISEMLHNFLKLICNCNSIGVLATAESTSKLNRSIYSSRGSHLFKNHYSILEFTKADRKTLLEQLFSKHMCEGISFDGLAIKTEGFVMQDIMDFFSKTIFESYKEDTENTNAVIRESHCENALKNTCVMSLQNVQFHTSGTKSFENVGGLHNVKDVLIESLLWPAQYPTIFSNSPLRLQSGLLLYGPPGTGKTLLAGAAAIHFGLRLISIKGPELLSKYIGASEQAVRDVFEKAQSARPCILFFDEFDSLAPRRGHDNTGVTDRVVNQLLTQLDGVESLSGVCVLAATSRPDLLDPALLRPGRLDKQLLCPLPNMMDRLEVLQVLSKNLDLATDIKLKEVAERTEGYSGADLQSILYTAQLSSVNYLFEDGNSEITSSEITQTHLMEALEKTKSSLTRSERLKYDKIYTKFQGGIFEDFKAGSKATLA